MKAMRRHGRRQKKRAAVAESRGSSRERERGRPEMEKDDRLIMGNEMKKDISSVLNPGT